MYSGKGLSANHDFILVYAYKIRNLAAEFARVVQKRRINATQILITTHVTFVIE